MFLAIFLTAGLLLLSQPKNANASEGTAQLKNVIGNDIRCSVYSVLMEDHIYTVLVSCRDLIYPADAGVFSYVLWANPLTGSGPIKFGELSRGKATFRSDRAFTLLFVTREKDPATNAPSPDVVMSGVITPDPFLSNPANSNTPTRVANPQNFGEIIGPSPIPTPIIPPASAASRAGRFVAAGGIIALGGILLLIVIIVFITRPKR